MNTKILFAIAMVIRDNTASNDPLSYLIGGVVALLILGYLIYSLLKPEKF